MNLWLSELSAGLLELFFPDRCAVCGGGGGLLCPLCRGALRPYPPEGPTPGLDTMAIGWIYDGAVRRAVHSMKYRRRRRVAGALADALALGLAPPAADALIPVPLHAERLAERGFNQAEELARRLGQRWGLPVCATGLRRARDTGHQARLGRAERQTNVAGAFVWCGAGPPPARPLLVDDILTTGATLAACAAALRAAGSREVGAVALARSLADRDKGAMLQYPEVPRPRAAERTTFLWRNADVRAKGADPGGARALGAADALAGPGAGTRARGALHDHEQRPGRAALYPPRPG